MMLLRPAKSTDLDNIDHLASSSGAGITTLSRDRKVIKDRLLQSQQAFVKKIHQPANEQYFFVLEDTTTQRIVGTSAILALNSRCQTTYHYQMMQQQMVSPSLHKRVDVRTLHLRKNGLPCSELCTLYLDPAYRKNHNGRLLSRGRFLYIHHNPQRFARKIIADVRGYTDELGVSPFWEALGRHFFGMSFAEADHLFSLGNTAFIEELMPKYPIYTHLLPQNTRAVIGQPHPDSIAAMQILAKEGFVFNQYVDIFDAGPTLAIMQKNLRIHQQCDTYRVHSFSDDLAHDLYYISNMQPHFLCCIAKAILLPATKHAIISRDTAELLAIKSDQLISLSPLG